MNAREAQIASLMDQVPCPACGYGARLGDHDCDKGAELVANCAVQGCYYSVGDNRCHNCNVAYLGPTHGVPTTPERVYDFQVKECYFGDTPMPAVVLREGDSIAVTTRITIT